jgi:hypothetical protein
MFLVYGGKCFSRKAVLNWVEKFSQVSSKVADDGTKMRKWLRQQSKRLLHCGFRRTGKAMGQVCQCWWRIFREINVFSPPSSNVLRFISICDLFTDSPSYYPSNCLEGLRKSKKTPVRIVCVPVEVATDCLPNTSLQSYCYADPIGPNVVNNNGALLADYLAYSSTLKIEATRSSATSVDFQRTTRRCTPEDVSVTTAVRISDLTQRI